MKVLNDNVLMQEVKDNKKGKIILSNVSQSRAHFARIVAVGDEVKKVKKGETVVFDPFVPREVEVEGLKYLIIKEKNIYAIL